MNPSLFALNDTGGAIPTTGGIPPRLDFNGGTPVLLQKLAVSGDGGPGGYYVAGLQYTPDAQMCVTTTQPPIIYVAGLPVSRLGRLCCVVGGPIATFQQGIPLSPSGRVVLANIPP